MAHPFRFACEIHAPFEGRTWPDTFREIEQLGYATAFLPDHFHEGPGPLAAMARSYKVNSSSQRSAPV